MKLFSIVALIVCVGLVKSKATIGDPEACIPAAEWGQIMAESLLESGNSTVEHLVETLEKQTKSLEAKLVEMSGYSKSLGEMMAENSRSLEEKMNLLREEVRVLAGRKCTSLANFPQNDVTTASAAITCPPTPTPPQRTPVDCDDLYQQGVRQSGVYHIKPRDLSEPIRAHCELDGSKPWTYLMRRSEGNLSYHRYWSDYKHGFGDVESDYWIGLQNIWAITNQSTYELRIEFNSGCTNYRYYASYDSFLIGPESDKYRFLHLGPYSGNTGFDALRQGPGRYFSTVESKNNGHPPNCAQDSHRGNGGGWWYKGCSHVYPTAHYGCDVDGCMRWYSGSKYLYSITDWIMKVSRV